MDILQPERNHPYFNITTSVGSPRCYLVCTRYRIMGAEYHVLLRPILSGQTFRICVLEICHAAWHAFSIGHAYRVSRYYWTFALG